MRFAQWLKPPRRTLAIFLGLMSLFGGALAWPGWQWLEQDRALERQRVQERLEHAADAMAAEAPASHPRLGAISWNPGGTMVLASGGPEKTRPRTYEHWILRDFLPKSDAGK